jgi:nuclear pore complex protein Nup155
MVLRFHSWLTSCRLSPQVQSALLNLTFQTLLTTTDGRDIAKQLVTALIEQQIGQELGVSTCSPCDIWLMG